jgi:hypothetical protein
MSDNAHQFLHIHHYAKYFEKICTMDLIDILTGDTAFEFMGGLAQEVLDWGFLPDVAGPLTDMAQDKFELSSGRIIPSRDFKDGLQFQSMFYSNDDDLPVVFDMGAMISMSTHKKDFISWEEKGNVNIKLHGISAATEVQGVGIIQWMVQDDRGR